jgi:hypothetical protein
MAPDPISTMYFINSSHRSMCLYVHPLFIARQRLSENVTAATNAHKKLDNCSACRSIRSSCRIKQN